MIRLKELREDIDIDQKVLAIDLHVSQPTISDWESGKKTPSIENIIRLADYFRVSIDYLMYRSDTTNPNYVHSDCWDGHHIRDLRQQRRETPKNVADAIGISVANYNRYESAQIDPPIDILCKLADHFGQTVDFLVERVWGLYDESGNLHTNSFHIKSKEEQFLVERFRLSPQISVSELSDFLSLFQNLNSNGRNAVLSTLQGLSTNPDFLLQSAQNKNLA